MIGHLFAAPGRYGFPFSELALALLVGVYALLAGVLRLGFIGAGRLGKALAWACDARGLTVTACASRTHSDATALAQGIDGCEALDAQSVADRCDLVFITTQDAAIAPTTASLRWRPGCRVVHCSGATEIAALDAAARAGPQVRM